MLDSRGYYGDMNYESMPGGADYMRAYEATWGEEVPRIRVPHEIAGKLHRLVQMEPMWPPDYERLEGGECAAFRCRQHSEYGLAQLHGVASERGSDSHPARVTHEWLRMEMGLDGNEDDMVGAIHKGYARYELHEQALEAHILDPFNEREAFGQLALLYHGLQSDLYHPTRSPDAQRCMQMMLELSGGEAFSHPMLIRGASAVASAPIGQRRSSEGR